MDQTTVDGIRSLLELGWPAIVTIQLVVIWRELRQFQQKQAERTMRVEDDYIEFLKQIAGIRVVAGPGDWPLPTLPPRPPTPPGG